MPSTIGDLGVAQVVIQCLLTMITNILKDYVSYVSNGDFNVIKDSDLVLTGDGDFNVIKSSNPFFVSV